MMNIKLLVSDDWQIWKDFRLIALQDAPEGFGSSYEEEALYDEQAWRQWLSQSAIFVTLHDNKMVGSAGFYIMKQHKAQHRGALFGMYVAPEYRRMGIASLLVKAVIDYAKIHVMQIHLSCVTSNAGAITLYQKHGFTIYGTEPQSLQINGVFLDEYLMILKFK